MKIYVILILSVIIFASIMEGCKHEIPQQPGSTSNTDPNGTGGDQVCDPDTVYFQNKVLPLIIQSCAMSDCHDADNPQDGIQLTSYQSIMATADVRPGRPENSDLYEVIQDNEMPQPGPPNNLQPLTAEQKNLIYKWIAQGALNNKCNDCDTTEYSYTNGISRIINDFCFRCHSGPGVNSTGGGILLDSYDNVKAIAVSGRLYPAVSHTGPYQMPKGGNKLSDCRITQIKKWIDNNYPN